MRTVFSLSVAVVALVFTGCAGPENKLGRGVSNLTAFIHGGDIGRSVEQTAVWEGPERAHTTGIIRGFNRAVARTGIGVYEVVTFPFPPYKPVVDSTTRLYPDPSIRTKDYPYGGLVLPEYRSYPDSYRPGLFDDSIFFTDNALGFSGGDVFPLSPGSRFNTLGY
jgi:putative exosortase-associated protein (TIGR04073 family)